MSRKRTKKNDFPEIGSFVSLYRDMQRSLAYQDLSDKAKLAYQNIKFNHYGDNAKEIICPFSTLINKMAPATWTRVIRELQGHGFITLEQESRGLQKIPNKYGLSNKWKHWGTDQFVESKISCTTDPIKGFTKLWKQDREKMMQLRQKRVKKSEL